MKKEAPKKSAPVVEQRVLPRRGAAVTEPVVERKRDAKAADKKAPVAKAAAKPEARSSRRESSPVKADPRASRHSPAPAKP